MRTLIVALTLLSACDGRSLPLAADDAWPSTEAGPPAPLPSCLPMDAVGAGDCAVALGFRWDGSRCRAIGGCGCSGTACAQLFVSEKGCISAMAQRCLPCTAMVATVTGLCLAEYGYFWNGLSCHSASGCSCSGPDCGKTFDTREACELAFAHCTKRTPVTAPCVRNAGHTCAYDADCAVGGCGGELCYNPKLGGGESDCDCGPPSGLSCGCVGGRCLWWE